MGDRRALITADIANAGLQQCLGNGENALATEFLSRAEAPCNCVLTPVVSMMQKVVFEPCRGFCGFAVSTGSRM